MESSTTDLSADRGPGTVRPRSALCLRAAAALAVLAFTLLVARFWHPAYGFTKFLQLDASDEKVAIHELHDVPVYYYHGNDGYDGAAYVQIAYHPLLDSKELETAIGNVPYRARRILGSALAWVLAFGRPEWIAQVYAALNIGVWLFLAALVWRVLAVADWRGWLAWFGFLFSAGALHSVRLALTDLPGVTLLALALFGAERQRTRTAYVALSLAGLARETALGGVVALWRSPWNSLTAWRSNLVRTLVVALPLGLWMGFIYWRVGPAPQGLGNFTWPVVGFIGKWSEIIRRYTLEPSYAWLNTTTLLATFALTVQAAYFIRRPRIDDRWWRVGAVGVAMMLLFGTAVWEGHPGAATRVLLPLSLAFAVLVVRDRASWRWLIAGNLSVFSGVLALWHVPTDGRELAAGRAGDSAYLIRLDAGWYGPERNAKHRWAWTADTATLGVESWPRQGPELRIRVGLRALSARTVEIREAQRVLWHGTVGTQTQFVVIPDVPRGQTKLEFTTNAPPIKEGPQPEARGLGLAVSDPRLD